MLKSLQVQSAFSVRWKEFGKPGKVICCRLIDLSILELRGPEQPVVWSQQLILRVRKMRPRDVMSCQATTEVNTGVKNPTPDPRLPGSVCSSKIWL